MDSSLSPSTLKNNCGNINLTTITRSFSKKSKVTKPRAKSAKKNIETIKPLNTENQSASEILKNTVAVDTQITKPNKIKKKRNYVQQFLKL